MLAKAVNRSQRPRWGLFAWVAPVAASCILTMTLSSPADAAPTVAVTHALGATAQATVSNLSSATNSIAGQAPAAPPAPAASAAPAVPSLSGATIGPPVEHAARPASGAASPTALARSVPAVTAAVVSVGGQTIASDGTPRGAARATLGTILQTASSAREGAPPPGLVSSAIHRVGGSPAATVRAATQAVVHAAGQANVAHALAPPVSGVGGALTQTNGSPTRRALARTASVAGAVARGVGATRGGVIGRSSLGRRPGGSDPAGAAVTPPATVTSGPLNGPHLALTATPLTAADFGPWDVATAPPTRARIGATTAPAAQPGSATSASRSATGLLAGVQSAVSSTGVHSAPPPAHPPPAPSSPGAISPATAAGAAGGISVALALAALLMLAAPRALRRLRLAGEQWRLTPLVLISDRPG